MKKLKIMVVASIVAAVCSAGENDAVEGAYSVSDVTISQNAITRLVTVSYTLGEKPAIVTVDFLTNGVSIGERNFNNVFGAVNRLVTLTGAVNTICWQPRKSWPGNSGAELSAKVSLWRPDAPPDYLVVSLDGAVSVPPRAYYVSTNALPGGLESDIYRTSRLVMRRIPAAGVTWQMGATEADYLQAGWSKEKYDGISDSDKLREVPHNVTLTYDYYLGIYPVTQEQYRRLTGASALGGYFTTYADSALRPRCGINYDDLRGSGTDTEHSSAASDSAIGKIRAFTGIDFDLPTDAEWEYACKAGSTWLLYTGDTYTLDNVKKLAWISSNSSGETRPVGRKIPNAWGLYDMIGNTLEWCRDYWVKDLGSAEVVDPVNDVRSDNRVMRGSRYNYVWSPYAHTTYRTSDIPNRSHDQAKAYGFRLMCPITLKFSVQETDDSEAEGEVVE